MSDDSLPPAVEEGCCRRFEQAWREGQPVAIEDCLPPPEHPLFLATLEELVVIDLDFRARAGRPGDTVRVEEYLARFPALNEPGRVARLLREEARARRRANEVVTAQEYQARFPQLAQAALPSTLALPGRPAPAAPGAEGELPLPAVPGYEVLGVIGRGAMGVVYRARQVSLGRTVALKMVLSGAHAGLEQRARFRAEAEAIARLQHPNIVTIYEVGEHQGLPYLSLELCPGGSLDRVLAGTPQPPRQAAALVRALALAVQHAHEQGVVHRDLKPANVLLSAEGAPKVADFGLAKRLEGAAATQSGALLGTALYMAPEQAAGRSKEVGPAADVYALGVILYECLTGRPPFQGEAYGDVLPRVLSEEPLPPSRLAPKCPRDLETICLKCLEKAPARRYGSAAGLADDLGRFLNGEPIRARPVRAPERFVKWARRRPAVAALLAGIVLLTVAALGVTTGLYHNAAQEAERAREAETQAGKDRDHAVEQEGIARREGDRARKEADRAEKQRTRAEGMLYASQIQAALREWEAGNVERAWQHLDACRWDYRGLEHRYLYALFNQNQITLRGHAVNSLAVSAAGDVLVSGGWDKTVKVWDARTGKELRALAGHTNGVLSVGLSADGRRIVSGSAGGTVKVWDARTGRNTFTLPGKLGGFANSVAISPDGNRVVNGYTDGALRSWDASTGKELFALRAHRARVQSVAFSADGRRIVSSSSGEAVKVWDAHTGKHLLDLKGHIGPVSGEVRSSFSPDGSRIVTCSMADGLRDNNVLVWDAHTGKELLSLEKYGHGAWSVAFSPDGRHIVGGVDRTVKVWDARTGKRALALKGHSDTIKSVAFSGDGGHIVSGGSGGLKVWDTGTHQGPLPLVGHANQVSSVAVSADGSLVVSGSHDRTVKAWDARTGKELFTFEGHPSPVRTVALSRDGARVAAGYHDGTLKGWDARTGKGLFTRKAHPAGVMGLALSADGRRVFTGSDKDEAVKVWDAGTGKHLLTLTGHTTRGHSVAASADGRIVVSAGGWEKDASVKVWDAETGKELRALKGTDPRLAWGAWSVAVSPDGGRVVRNTGEVWDVRTGKELFTLPITSAVYSLTFSPDGRRIVGGTGRGVMVWDAGTGQHLLTLEGARGGAVNSVAVSADGSRIVAGGWGPPVTVWGADASQDRLILQAPVYGPTKVVVSADGARVFGQKEKGKAFAWDATSGQLLPDAPAQMPAGGREAASADGRLRASVEGGVIRVRRADLEQARARREARDRARLAQLARPSSDWHREQLEAAFQADDDFAADFHLGRLVRARPWDAGLHVQRAHVLARLGRPQESATHLMHALFLSPRVHLWPIDPAAAQRGEEGARAGDWPRAARALLLAAHQPQAPVGRLADLLLAQRAAGDKAGARMTLGALSLRLEEEKDPRVVAALFTYTLVVPWEKRAAGPMLAHARQGLERGRNAFSLAAWGIALYRAGRYEEAERALAASVKAHGKGGYVGAWLFQAMTARQLGKHDEALRLLARFEARHARQKFATWQQRMVWEVLLREAHELIHAPPPMPRAHKVSTHHSIAARQASTPTISHHGLRPAGRSSSER